MNTADYRTFINRDLPYVEKSCTSKIGFVSRAEARNALRHGRRASGQLESYHCGICDLWHLGHHRHK